MLQLSRQQWCVSEGGNRDRASGVLVRGAGGAEAGGMMKIKEGLFVDNFKKARASL